MCAPGALLPLPCVLRPAFCAARRPSPSARAAGRGQCVHERPPSPRPTSCRVRTCVSPAPRWLRRSKAANTRSGFGPSQLWVGLSGTETSFQISRLKITPLPACSPLTTGVSVTHVHTAAETDLSLLQWVQMPKGDVRGTPPPQCANAPLLGVAAGVAASRSGGSRARSQLRAPSAAHKTAHFPSPLLVGVVFFKRVCDMCRLATNCTNQAF